MKAASKVYDEEDERSVKKKLEANIDEIIKKHLRIGFQTVIEKGIITPYDIIRHYEPEIPVYDYTGQDISLLREKEALQFHLL